MLSLWLVEGTERRFTFFRSHPTQVNFTICAPLRLASPRLQAEVAPGSLAEVIEATGLWLVGALPLRPAFALASLGGMHPLAQTLS